MNKKGFTLIELIAVIAILGIIAILAITSVSRIQKQSKVKAFIHTQKRIEVAAEKFYNDTGLYNFDVQVLIDRGYIESEKNGKIYDTRTDKEINNSLIVIDEISKKAKLYVDDDYSGSNYNIIVKLLNGELYNEENWIDDDITLSAYLEDKNGNPIQDNIKYTWFVESSPGDESHDSSFNFQVNNGKYLHEKILITIIHNGLSYTKKLNVKISKEPPHVPTSIVSYNGISNKVTSFGSTDDWTNQDITWSVFSLESTNGPGIDHYEYSKDCTEEVTGNLGSSYTYPIDDRSTYKYCIRAVDKAGRASEWSEPYIFQIDKIAPTCSMEMDGYWNVILSSKEDSGGSGLSSYGIGGYNSTTSRSISANGTITSYVMDGAGNENTCSIRVAYDSCLNGSPNDYYWSDCAYYDSYCVAGYGGCSSYNVTTCSREGGSWVSDCCQFWTSCATTQNRCVGDYVYYNSCSDGYYSY